MKRKLLLVLMFCLPVFCVFAAAPTVKIAELGGNAPKIDGRMEDGEWKNAAVLNDFILSGTKRKAVNRTEVYLLKDKHVFYLAAKCFDSEMDKLSGKDWFEIFFADPDAKIYYHFYLFSNGGKGQDGSPGVFLFGAPHWQAKTSRHADRWEVEVAIPFFNLAPEYMNTENWRFNVCRQKVSGLKENSQWADTGGYFHVPERFGILAGMKNMDFVPYVAISQQIRDEKTEDCKLPSYFLPDRSYYTTETKAEFKLCLSTDTQTKLGKTVRAEMSLDGKKTAVPVKNRKAYASFDISGLACGTYPVTARVTDGNNTEEFKTELVKLPPSKNEVKINRFTRLLLVNGKPFIPLICEIMLHGGTRLPDPAAPENGLELLARNSGFNTLSFWWTHPAAGMPVCAKENVMVIPALVDIMASKQPKEPQYRKTVAEFAGEPNLLAWLIADEGNIGESEEEYTRTYRLMKTLDPYHPVFRNESGWTIGYGGPGGLKTTDIFCGGYGGAKSARAMSIDAVPHGAPVFLLTAAFGIPEKHRYLSSKETVCWVYQILINGATGAFWWGAHSGQQPVPLWETVRQLRREIDVLTPVFNTESMESGVGCSNENISHTLRFHDGKYYLITVNLTEEEQQGIFQLDGSLFPQSGSAENLFEKQTHPYSGSVLKLQYEPQERKVLCIGKRSS